MSGRMGDETDEVWATIVSRERFTIVGGYIKGVAVNGQGVASLWGRNVCGWGLLA